LGNVIPDGGLGETTAFHQIAKDLEGFNLHGFLADEPTILAALILNIKVIHFTYAFLVSIVEVAHKDCVLLV
jgi:hypothetical protein